MMRYLPNLAVALLLFVGAISVNAAYTRLEIVELKSRPASEMIPLLQPLAEPEGTVSGQGFKLFIRATPAKLAEIKRVIESIDIKQKRLLIFVRQGNSGSVSENRSGITGSIREGDVRADLPSTDSTAAGSVTLQHDRSRLRAYADKQATDSSDNIAQRIQTLEGQPAFIYSGVSVPLRNRSVIISPTGSTIERTTSYEDVTSGFYILPRIRGDEVLLEINPQHESIGRHREAINIQRSYTVVRGKVGEWINIGGTTQSSHDISSGYTSSSDRRSAQNYGVDVKITIIE